MELKSPAFTIMVEGGEQTYAYDLAIALPGGIYPGACKAAVSALQIEQSFTSDLPEGTRLLEGFPATSATFTLSGMVDPTNETKTAEWLFSPYSTGSPLYRQDAFRSPVTIDLGLLPATAAGTPDLVRKFSGYVDSYSVATDGSVQFTCIDKRSDLRSVPQLPAVVTAPPYNAGLTSEFAIDYLLRAATKGAVSSWPAQRPQCILAAGMRASIWPEVGTVATDSVFVNSPTDTPLFIPGVYGSAVTGLTNSSLASVNVSYSLASPIGTTVFLEAWVTGVHDAGGGLVIVQFGSSLGRIKVQLEGDGMFVTWPDGSIYQWLFTVTDAPHYIAASIVLPAPPASGTVTGTANGTLYYDNLSQVITPKTGYVRSSSDYNYAAVRMTLDATVEALQMTTESTPVLSYPFTPRAVLDPSLNALQTVPFVSDSDPWQAIQQITQAELGAAGYLADPDTFRFYNRERLRGGQVSRTITSRSSLKSLGIDVSASSVVNRARVGYTGWSFAGTVSTIYSAENVIKVGRRSTRSVAVSLDNLATRIDTAMTRMPNGSVAVDTFYRSSTDAAGTSEFTGALTFRIFQIAPDKLTIEIVNTGGTDAYLVSPSNYTDITVGTPLLRVAGYAVTANTEQSADWQYPPATDGGAASSRFGEVVYEATGNPWIQDADSALQLATDIVCESAHPIPDLTGVDIVPDPRLQLTDRVRIQDPDETGVDEYARIFAITTNLTANDDGSVDYSQTVDARAITFPGGWILGVDGRSELGVTTWI